MKNPVVLREAPAKATAPKGDFLNDDQRKELKKLLIEKYTKLYGLCNPAVVVEEVNKFFQTTAQVNQKALTQLENVIKKAMLSHKSKAMVKPPLEAKKEVQATPTVQFPEAQDEATQCAPAPRIPQAMKDCAEFEGLRDDEWDNIGVYQAYILRQEKELERKRKQLEQKAVRAQLGQQVREKGEKEVDLRTEHLSYVNLENMQHDRHLKHQEAIAMQKMKEKKDLFDMQTKMIQSRNTQLNKEKKIQDEIDRKIMDSIETDLAKQRELQQLRAEAKRQEMVRVRGENDTRKQQKLDEEERDRKEDMELQRLANELAQDMENQRTAEIKAKADKIQQMMAIGDSAIQTQKLRAMEEEKKLLDYIARKNRLIEMKDKRIKEREKENKAKYQEILNLQMNERNDKLKSEKGYIREQATLWKQEEEYYNKFNETKAVAQKAGNEEYRKLLDQQVKEKEAKKKKSTGVHPPDEEATKALLLEQIRNLDLQNEILNEQLKISDA
jgi:hypothetical protein